MKKVLTLMIAICLNLIAFAGNDPYTKAMSEGMKMLQEAQGPQDFLEAANKFERIAEAEKDKWHPSYYASYAMAIVAAIEQDPAKKDQDLDLAQSFIEKAGDVEHNQSEVLALQGFIYMLRIGVDPASRGQQYSGMSAASLQRAKAIDPENPRVLYMLAQLSFGTAQFFGSDTSEACNLNNLALEKFEAAESVQNEDPFAPSWGRNMSEGFSVQCGN